MDVDNIKQLIKDLKTQSGTHSPSIETLRQSIGELQIKIDACFLSNPYATELFLKYLENDLIKNQGLRDYLEYYPPQNKSIAENISKFTGVESEKIFVGNGAIEIIQAVIQRFAKGKMLVPIPTFSSYYEFAHEELEVVKYQLEKETEFSFNFNKMVEFIELNKINSIVLINPNNPNGGYISRTELTDFLSKLRKLEMVILDESFIHFAYEEESLNQINNQRLLNDFENLIIIKSMSKDFGIAGIRAGYALMNERYVKSLLNNGYLWNISGLATYFFQLYGKKTFQEEYEIVRKKYITITNQFFSELKEIDGIKVYDSKANFALVELKNNYNSFDFTLDLLLEKGIYVRDCSDKIGLDGQYIRVASRTFEENLKIVEGIKNIISKNTL